MTADEILPQFEEVQTFLRTFEAYLFLLAMWLVVCNGMCQACLLVVSSDRLLPVPHYNIINRSLLHCCGDEKPRLSQDVLLGTP